MTIMHSYSDGCRQDKCGHSPGGIPRDTPPTLLVDDDAIRANIKWSNGSDGEGLPFHGQASGEQVQLRRPAVFSVLLPERPVYTGKRGDPA